MINQSLITTLVVDGGNEAIDFYERAFGARVEGRLGLLTIYCDDADALHARAIEAGATEITPVSDQLHGDRAGSLRCPFGHRWAIATRVEDLTPEEIQKRLDDAMG